MKLDTFAIKSGTDCLNGLELLSTSNFKSNTNYIYTFSSYRAVNTLRCVIRTNQLKLYSEDTAVCYEIHTNHTNMPRGLDIKCLIVKYCGTVHTVTS
jgi:hypothetical protein